MATRDVHPPALLGGHDALVPVQVAPEYAVLARLASDGTELGRDAAAEVVRRWNVYPDLLAFVERVAAGAAEFRAEVDGPEIDSEALSADLAAMETDARALLAKIGGAS